MWLLFIIVSLILYLAYDITGKKIVDAENKYTPLSLRFSVHIFGLVTAIAVYISGFCSSDFSIWQTIVNNPVIVLPFCLSASSELLYLVSLKYIDLTFQEAVSGTSSIVLFLGYTLISLFTSAFSSVDRLFVPLRFIPICLVMISTFLLPNIDIITRKRNGNDTLLKEQRKKYIIGIVIALIAVLMDAGESVATAYLFDTKTLNVADYFVTCCIIYIIPAIVFAFIFLKLRKNPFAPLKGKKCASVAFCLFFYGAIIFYLIGTSMDAIMSGMIFCVYPALAIIGARIILKERYSKYQYVCVWVIVIASVVFGLADYLIQGV